MKFENNHNWLNSLVKALGFLSGLALFTTMFYIIWTKSFFLIKNNYKVILTVIILTVICYFLKIKFFSKFYDGFKKFSRYIVYSVNFVLLSIVYFIGVGMTSIIAKIFGKHFLNLKKKSVNSYYNNKNIGEENLEKYYNQF